MTDEKFQGQCFLWEKRASVGLDSDLFNFQDLSHAQEPLENMKNDNKL